MAAEKKILIAVDESENSKIALLYVAEFLGGFPGFQAVVLSVLSVPEIDFFDSASERENWVTSKKAVLSAMLERYRSILLQSGFPDDKVVSELVLTEDKPISTVILEKQQQYSACTLVVGRRGVSRHEEFLFGSVSNKLVHLASKCAVWVIEPVCEANF